jgi:hypothetical protein
MQAGHERTGMMRCEVTHTERVNGGASIVAWRPALNGEERMDVKLTKRRERTSNNKTSTGQSPAVLLRRP